MKRPRGSPIAFFFALSVLAACGGGVKTPPSSTGGGGGSGGAAGSPTGSGGTSAGLPGVGGAGAGASAGGSRSGGADSGATPGAWTVKLGPAGNPHMPGIAFAGNTLGVAASSGSRDLRLLLDIDRGDGVFSQVDLGLRSGYNFSGLAAADDAFVVSWWGTTDPGGIGPGTVETATIGVDGTLRSRVAVAGTMSPVGCDAAYAGGVTAVACGGGIFSLCRSDACMAPSLPACNTMGDARVVWDGASFAVARVCSNGATGATLRLARVSTTGNVQGAELAIVVPGTASPRPGLIATQDRAVLAYAGNTYAVAGTSVGAPALFAAPPPGWETSSLGFEGELTQVGDKIVASSCWYSYGTLDGGVAASKLVVLGANFAPVGAPLIDETGCARMRAAVSPSGTVHLARDDAGSWVGHEVAVQTLDVASGTLGAPRFFDGALPSALADVRCDGPSCRIATSVTGTGADLGNLPSRLTELSFTAGAASAASEVRSYEGCLQGFGCSALFTNSGALVIFDMARGNAGANVRWIAPDGTLRWRVPLADASVSWGPIGRDHPYLATDVPGSASVIHLEEQGTSVIGVDGTLSPAVLCDQGLYQVFPPGGGQFRPLLSSGWGPALPTGVSLRGEPVCIGNQLGTLDAPSGYQYFFRRVSLDGRPLTDVMLPYGPIITQAGAGDDVYFLISTRLDPGDPQTAMVLAHVALDGTVDTHPVVLPEPGFVSLLSVNAGYAAIGWLGERATWLSVVPLP